MDGWPDDAPHSNLFPMSHSTNINEASTWGPGLGVRQQAPQNERDALCTFMFISIPCYPSSVSIYLDIFNSLQHCLKGKDLVLNVHLKT